MESSQSSDRSRSQRGFDVVGAVQGIANPMTPSQSITTSESTSQSTPEPRGNGEQRLAIPEHRVVVPENQQSPETLSQFLGSPQSSPLVASHANTVQMGSQDHFHSNPFHGQYDSTRSDQQGASSSQGQTQGPTFIKNELNVTLDPLVVAQAAQAVEEARSSYQVQAIQAVEESRRVLQAQASQSVENFQTSVKTEAMQYLEQYQSQAQRAISESHAQSVQLQKELEDSRVGATQIVQEASREIESIKSLARAEIQRVKVEAQSTVSGLEGRISELVHINNELSMRSNEQIQLIKALTQRVDEQQSVMSKLQNNVAMSPTSRAANGADDPVPLQLPVTSGFGQTRSGLDSELRLRTGGQTGQCLSSGSVASPVQDPQVQLFAMPTHHEGSHQDSQLKELAAQVESLAYIVQGFATNQGGGRVSKGNGSNRGSPNTPKQFDLATPPRSPPGSSSSSSSSKGSGGGGSDPPTPPRGSPASRVSSSSNQSHVVDPYKHEKKIMRVKQYEYLKIPNLPRSASDARAFRNAVFNLVCKLAKGDETSVFQWIEKCVDPKMFDSLQDSFPFPLLDRVLGSKLLELSKNTRFAMHFQTIQEASQRVHKQPKGRQLLWIIFEKYKMERDRGVALTQSHLLNLKMQGSDVKALEDFRNKFDFIWQALEVSDRPSDSSLRSLLFEQLKSHPKLQLAIDRFRNASRNSSKRSYLWLYDKLVEAIEIHQLEENTASIEKSLANIASSSKDANAAPSKPAKEKSQAEKNKDKDKQKDTKDSKPDKPSKPKAKQEDKPDKQQKAAQPSDVQAAAAKGKGTGKGNKRDDKSPKGKKVKEEDKKKLPCMYYGYDSCNRGNECPYLHDPQNKYKGPKPRGLMEKGASSNAGAATVAAATVVASQVKPASGQDASRTYAPYQAERGEVGDHSTMLDKQPSKGGSFAKGVFKQARRACREFLKSKPQKPKPRLNVPRVGVFEKAVKVFTAIAACVNPVLPQVSQEFLLDTGAGRNLISSKTMPAEFQDYIIDAPEKIQFSTGGGKKPSTQAIMLEGSLSGKNTFYTLKDCPHALSVGIQVNEHQRPFIWFPGQLPYLVKADRASEIAHHVPESAKIYADRVHENVPIVSERMRRNACIDWWK